MRKRRYIVYLSFILLGMGLLWQGCGSMHALTKEESSMEQLTADQLFMKAEHYKLHQEPEEAIRFFKAFQKLKPDNATAPFEIARQYNLLQKRIASCCMRAGRLH